MNSKQMVDIKLSIKYMEIINEISGSNFKFQRELDIKREGGSTPSQPEALFWDYEADKGGVIEIKSFAYVTDNNSSNIQNKIAVIQFWITKHFRIKKMISNADCKYVCVLTIHDESFNPNFIIRELEQTNDLFAGYSSKYVALDLYKLYPRDCVKDLNLSFEDIDEGDTSFIQKYSQDFELENTIAIAKDYELFADRLMHEWKTKKWSEKFVLYPNCKKILFIDIDMRSALGIAYLTGDFQLYDFVAFFIEKYAPTYPFLFNEIDDIYFKIQNQIIQIKS